MEYFQGVTAWDEWGGSCIRKQSATQHTSSISCSLIVLYQIFSISIPPCFAAEHVTFLDLMTTQLELLHLFATKNIFNQGIAARWAQRLPIQVRIHADRVRHTGDKWRFTARRFVIFRACFNVLVSFCVIFKFCNTCTVYLRTMRTSKIKLSQQLEMFYIASTKKSLVYYYTFNLN